MTTTLERPPIRQMPADGGMPARRAVVRWAWRLFRREWRQQFLILSLIVVAAAATIVGSTVATNTPPPKNAGFGTAQDSVSFTANDSRTSSAIANLEHRVDRVELIENATQSIPGSIDTFQLRAQDSHGPFSGPMLSLVSGDYPRQADQVAVTSGVASAFHLKVGATWRVGGVERTVSGIVENPQSLLDEFALLVPGQVIHPTSITALFDAQGASLKSLGSHVQTPSSVAQSNPLNPETISLAALVLGMLLIALVSIGGFTVLAQRRLRSIGMLESLGATDRHVRLVVSANGTVVGLVGAVIGFVLGFLVWLAYRPSLQQSAHHVIGVLAFSWTVVIAAIVLAVVAAYFAASRPARAITKVPIVQALSGRPAPPRQIRRSALPGIVFLVLAFLLLGYAGGTNNGNGGGGSPELLFGIVLLVPGLIMLAPFFLSLTALLARRAPIAVRIALRDLARYRARSGSALAAISLGVLVAVIVLLAAASRYGNVLDYAGPNLAANQLALNANVPPPVGSTVMLPDGKTHVQKASSTPSATPQELAAHAQAVARGLGAQLVDLKSPQANLNATQGGRNWNGQIYVATPQLLHAFGIKASDIDPDADVLSSRPGLSGVSGLTFTYGSNDANGRQGPGSGPPRSSQCGPSTGCLAHPVVQEIGALPTGTSAPNTVITEHAMKEFRIQAATNHWLILGTKAFSGSEISNAELAASTSQLSVESKNDQPSSSAVITWATIFGIVIALGVLGMSVGLVRSETASELRTLAATGASRRTRRTLTAVTAGALGFLGALLGTVGGYIGMLGWLRSNSLNGGIGALGNVPVRDLLIILFGMPAFAAAVGWVFAGRQPAAMAHQPME
ncbi:MAG TPA: FtsX-like permease family protein [Acidimicrobiales bacterium]|jgi:putative ABC transport system permease protein|nr:FtsX-like permease family protein [Acidimicrobiales bacterium]